MEKIFVDPDNPTDVISFLETMATDTDLNADINLFSQTKKEQAAPLSNIAFQISLKGSFVRMVRFLEKVEAGPYLIQVQDITMKKVDSVQSQGIEATLLLEVVTQKK